MCLLAKILACDALQAQSTMLYSLCTQLNRVETDMKILKGSSDEKRITFVIKGIFTFFLDYHFA